MASKADDTNCPSTQSLIQNGKWRRALFTSFTLSLTYFESYLLPHLRKSGCEAIDIYVDAFGHRHCLAEQQSAGTGRDYRVAPVALNCGIFHPKLVHLWASAGEIDCLIVASGNLTYSGHGGNLEAMEVLRADRHAQAFLEAAAFFEDLLANDRVRIGDTAGMRASLARLRELGRLYENVEDVHFVHNLHTSGLDQLTEAAEAQPIEEVLVLSPYHHVEGVPVRQIMERTGATRLIIGVDPQENTTTFPYEQARAWANVTVTATAPDAPARRLHAKWFELRARDSSVCLVGSFNATQASLMEQDNIECAVLRRLPGPSSCWLPCADPRTVPQRFMPEPAGPGALPIFATLTGACIAGQILSHRTGLAGVWQLWAGTTDTNIVNAHDVQVDNEGRFRLQLEAEPAVLRLGSMQLRLARGQESARGWVSIAHVLALSADTRSLVGTAHRLQQGDETPRDFRDILTRVAGELAKLFDPGKMKHKNPPNRVANGSAQSRTGRMSAEQYLQACEAVRDAQAARDSLERAVLNGEGGWDELGPLVDLLAGFRRTNGNERHRRPPRWSRADDAPQSDGELNERMKREKASRSDLAQFEVDALRKRVVMCERWDGKPDLQADDMQQVLMDLARLDVTRLRVALRGYLFQLDDLPGAISYLGNWLHEVCAVPYCGDSRYKLLLDVAGASAVLALQCVKRGGKFDCLPKPGQTVPFDARVGQFIEYFFGPDPDRAALEQAARTWLSSDFGFQLLIEHEEGERVVDAITALRQALAHPTPQARLRAILQARQVNGELAATPPLPAEPLQVILDLVSSGALAPEPVDFRNLSRCPNLRCPHVFRPFNSKRVRVPDPMLVAALKVYGATRCPGCGTPLLSKEVAGNIQ